MMDLKGDGVDCGGVEHVGTKNRLVNVLVKVLNFSYRNCFLARFAILKPEIHSLSPQNKTLVIMCPTSTITAKLTNKYIKLMFESRKQLDEGTPIFNLGYEQGIAINPFFNDIDDSDSDSLPTN